MKEKKQCERWCSYRDPLQLWFIQKVVEFVLGGFDLLWVSSIHHVARKGKEDDERIPEECGKQQSDRASPAPTPPKRTAAEVLKVHFRDAPSGW